MGRCRVDELQARWIAGGNAKHANQMGNTETEGGYLWLEPPPVILIPDRARTNIKAGHRIIDDACGDGTDAT
eukprot:2526583-Rhodomonas_salina.4